jgi:transposase InsO family protein
VTEHPTAQWTGQQLVEALPWETTARYVIRDRDRIYGTDFKQRVAGLGLREALTAPRSPWQNAYAERFIGSLHYARNEVFGRHSVLWSAYQKHYGKAPARA